MTNPKLKLQAFLSLFCEWVESWLAKGPDRELLQLAHAQIGRVYAKIGKELKGEVFAAQKSRQARAKAHEPEKSERVQLRAIEVCKGGPQRDMEKSQPEMVGHIA